MTIQIKKEEFVTFIKKVMMTDKGAISECVFDFREDGLLVEAATPPQQAMVFAILKPSAFKEYSQIGQIGIGDLTDLKKKVDKFKEFVEIKVEGNLLTVSENKKTFEIELSSIEYITNGSGLDNVKKLSSFVDNFMMTAKDLKDLRVNAQMIKDSKLHIETKEGAVLFSAKGKGAYKDELMSPSCKGGAKASYGMPLFEAIENLSDTVEIHIGNDYPLKIIEKTDNSEVTIIVAPHVDKE